MIAGSITKSRISQCKPKILLCHFNSPISIRNNFPCLLYQFHFQNYYKRQGGQAAPPNTSEPSCPLISSLIYIAPSLALHAPTRCRKRSQYYRNHLLSRAVLHPVYYPKILDAFRASLMTSVEKRLTLFYTGIVFTPYPVA